MSEQKYLVTETQLTDIADAIRLKRDTTTPITVEDMPMEIGLIEDEKFENEVHYITNDSDENFSVVTTWVTISLGFVPKEFVETTNPFRFVMITLELDELDETNTLEEYCTYALLVIHARADNANYCNQATVFNLSNLNKSCTAISAISIGTVRNTNQITIQRRYRIAKGTYKATVYKVILNEN